MPLYVHFFLDEKTNQKNQGSFLPVKAIKTTTTDGSNSLRSNKLPPFKPPCFLAFKRNETSPIPTLFKERLLLPQKVKTFLYVRKLFSVRTETFSRTYRNFLPYLRNFYCEPTEIYHKIKYPKNNLLSFHTYPFMHIF